MIGAPWAWARDQDDHHLRSDMFYDRAERMGMLGVSAAASYRLNTILALVGRVEYQHYFLGKGPTRMSNYGNGDTAVFGGPAAGIDHRSLLVSVGLKASLH